MRIIITHLHGGDPTVLDNGEEYGFDHLFKKLNAPISYKGFVESEDLCLAVDIVGVQLVTRTDKYTTITAEDLKRFDN